MSIILDFHTEFLETRHIVECEVLGPEDDCRDRW